MQYRYKKTDYTSPAGAWGGPSMSKSVTWYVGTPYLNMTAAQWKTVAAGTGLSLGDVWTLGGKAPASAGNSFMFVKYTAADTALTLGQLVTPDLPTTGTITVPGVPVTTTAAVTTNIDNSVAGANGEVDNWFYGNVTSATLPQLRRIKENTAAVAGRFTLAQNDWMRPNNPYDKDVLDTAATSADPCTVIRPWNVIVNTDATVPLGVSLGAVTAGNYTVIQVGGLAMISAIGDSTGLVVNQPAVGAAAGQIAGSAAAAENLFLGASLILPQFATTAGAPGILIPCFVNFMRQ
jgi:hypothetical protein